MIPSVAIAAMEYVYFARPDSDIGEWMCTLQENTGRRLAKEQPTPDADMVIGNQTFVICC